MEDRRELISVLRQIGIMMAAGVDFLRITAVLRAQTEDPRLLRLYDELDHDLTMGVSLADAMARQPDIFSPFAVSLVRQIEMRNEMAEMAQELAAAFHKIADYLQQDAALTRESGRAPQSSLRQITEKRHANDEYTAGTTGEADLHRLVAVVQDTVRRGLTALAVLCGAIALVYGAAALGLLSARWLPVAVWSVAAAGLGAAAWCVAKARAAVPAASRLDIPADEPAAEDSDPVPAINDSGAGESRFDAKVERLSSAAREPLAPARNWADMHGVSETDSGDMAPIHTKARPVRLANGRNPLQAEPVLAGPADAATGDEADYE